MKRLFFVMIMVSVVQLATAQVTLQPNVPTVGLIQKNQLWNMLIVNSTGTPYDCRLELILQDRTTGQEVLTATTAFFRVSPGGMQLNVNTVNPVQYTYIVAGIGSRLQGLIPAGNYTACYALISRANAGRPLVEECIQFDSEPLSPPMLIFPADSSILENAPVQFSWMPPTPDGMFNQLKYEIVITEINDGQKANEALQQNIPLFSDGNLFTNVFNYPTSAIALDKNKWYAWQIIAKDDRNYAGKSETWVFKINPNKNASTLITQAPFLKTKKNNPEKGIAPDGILKISYLNETTENIAIIKIIDPNNIKGLAPKFSIALHPGENLIQYDLKKIMQIQEGKVYEAEIINNRNERWVIQFENHNYN